MANQRKNNDDGWFSWALIVFLFAVGAWPVALAFLFIKLFADDDKKSRTAAPPLQKPAQSRQRRQPMTKGQSRPPRRKRPAKP